MILFIYSPPTHPLPTHTQPYVPYCDAFPDARAGWVDELEPAQPTDNVSQQQQEEAAAAGEEGEEEVEGVNVKASHDGTISDLGDLGDLGDADGRGGGPNIERQT